MGASSLCAIVAFLCIFVVTVEQVANETSFTPHKLANEGVAKACCEHNKSIRLLYSCVLDKLQSDRSSRQKRQQSSARVVIYTFLTENILSYGAFAVAINAVYAEQHGYDFLVEGFPETRVLEPDARWNKVQLLLRAVENTLTASNTSTDNPMYVVWLDADLVLLDLGMKIELVASEYPDADIIMSRDIARAEFVSNSGFVVVRASTWSLEFLERWWGTYDRTKCCDQNAFTWLYDELDDADKRHIRLLRADAINSNFPAWKNQADYNQVLHLAGASSRLFREPMFDQGFKAICVAQQNGVLKPQLGLSRTALSHHVSKLAFMRNDALRQLATEIRDQQNLCSISKTKFESKFIAAIKSKLEDIIKDDDDEVENLFNQLEAVQFENEKFLYTLRDWLFFSFYRHVIESPSSIVSLGLLEDVKEAVSCGFELVLTITDFRLNHSLDEKSLLKREILGKVMNLIEMLSIGVPESLKPRVLYFKFKHAQLMSSAFPQFSEDRLQWLTTAEDLWRGMSSLNYFGTDYVMPDPYKEGGVVILELGTLLCNRRNFTEGLRMLREATRLHELTISGYERIRIAARSDILSAKHTLMTTLTNLGICCVEYGGRDALESSITTLERVRIGAVELDRTNPDVSIMMSTTETYLSVARASLAEIVNNKTSRRVFRRRKKA